MKVVWPSSWTHTQKNGIFASFASLAIFHCEIIFDLQQLPRVESSTWDLENDYVFSMACCNFPLWCLLPCSQISRKFAQMGFDICFQTISFFSFAYNQINHCTRFMLFFSFSSFLSATENVRIVYGICVCIPFHAVW